ncbi:hypothetical protein J2W39_000037 [Variovorax paradoxus]|uniref:Uncharacterized protein n=1 Tax=Variovorax paradoxus TaxID=34073 RepID=A0AAW8E8I7_VARPD|nr:hypothetical protein [Variovorax paradoxus]MDP9968814.1 hypothetical protein [Variovorax paradoxus]
MNVIAATIRRNYTAVPRGEGTMTLDRTAELPAAPAATSPVAPTQKIDLVLEKQAPAQQPIAITLQVPPATELHWTAYVTAIGTPVVAVIAAAIAGLIAYRNWRTAQNKLKLDLFDKRYKVFEELSEQMAVWSEKWELQKSLQEFYSLQQRATFLFNDEVNDYLSNTVLPKLHEYAENYSQLHGINPLKNGRALLERDLHLKVWLADGRKTLKEVFKNDLKLKH